MHQKRRGRRGCLSQLSYAVALVVFVSIYVMFIQSITRTTHTGGPVIADRDRDSGPPQTQLPLDRFTARTAAPTTPTLPSTTPAPRATLLPSTSAPSTLLPVARPLASRCDGVDLSAVDASVHDNPGGTELEALAWRRAQSSALWPMPPFNQLPWRTIDARRSSNRRCVEQEVGPGAFPWQWHHHATTAERKDGGCDVSDFACLLKYYYKAMPQAAISNSLCDGVYGAKLVDRFRASDVSMCQSSGATMHCKMMTVHGTHDAETSVCRSQHTVVDFTKIQHGDYPWLDFHQGALELSCTDTQDGRRIRAEPQKHFMHCIADWMTLGYHSIGGGPAAACDVFEDTPTVFVTRSGDYSPFALTHDWINLVVLLAVEGLRVEDIQIVFMDRMTSGFYTPVWQYAFSPKRPLMWYPDFTDGHHAQHRSRVCYHNAYFNIPARLSPIYNEDECGAEQPGAYRSPLYHVYRDHILQSFGALWTVGGLPNQRLGSAVVVTLIMRRNYATGHSIGRRIANADLLTSALRQHLSDGGSGTTFVVNQVDFAEHDFDTQLNISRATDLLIAMHGAGLAQMMFMHPWGGVFEFFCPEKPSSNYRYHQLANKMGLRYDSYSIGDERNEVPIKEVMPQLQRLAHETARSKASFFDTSPT